MVTIKELFDLEHVEIKSFFDKYKYPVEVLPHIHDFILEYGKTLDKTQYDEIKENVWVSKKAQISDNVTLLGPCIIMDNATLRHDAFIRENVIISNGVTIGNSCEIKNSIILNDAEIPHFNYVGDSILGVHAHLGAGVIVSNLRLDRKSIRVEHEETSLRKIGAFIGDYSEIGCNSVICPGTVLRPKSMILPLSMVKTNT